MLRQQMRCVPSTAAQQCSGKAEHCLDGVAPSSWFGFVCMSNACSAYAWNIMLMSGQDKRLVAGHCWTRNFSV